MHEKVAFLPPFLVYRLTCKVWGGDLLIYRIDCSFNFFEIASAHFVGKFTYTHILAIFNLVQLSYILSIALLYVLSVRQKVPKNRAVVYGIRRFLCSQIASALAAAIFFSRFTPRRSLLVAMLGAARTRFAQTSCHLFPALLVCSLCLPTLPFR